MNLTNPHPSPKAAADPAAVASSLTFIPEVIPRGDGSFTLKPGKPIQKLTVKQCAQIAGCGVSTIYRLVQAYPSGQTRLADTPRGAVVSGDVTL